MCFYFLYIQTPRWNLRSNAYEFCPTIIKEQIGRCHQSFQYDFVANCSAGVWVLWKIRKVEKEKALNHHKQENNEKGCLGKFTEI